MRTRTGFNNFIPLAYLLPLIILIEGFASIAVEILTIRQLLPVAGGSVVVTSLIIGIFLLFLALGYDWGGRAQNKLENILRWNFFITAILTGIGLSYAFIEIFFNAIQHIAGKQILYPLLIYLMLVLAPIVFLLGQTLPITMNIVRQDRMAGVIAGKALGLSTVGSFLGAIFTTVVLMHYLGVGVTVFIVFILLMLLALLLSPDLFKFTIKFIVAIFAGWLIYILNISYENNVFVRTTTYGNYQIVDNTSDTGQRYLIINNSLSSMIDEVNNSAFSYIEMIKKILFDDLKLRHADILVLGAAGFTLSQTSDFNFDNHFTYVDIEDQLKKIIVPGFVKKVDDELVVDDARHFVKTTNKQYDAIVVDVFSNAKSIPAHLLTREFMREVKKAVKPKGVIIFNIIAKPTLSDPYSKHVDNTIRSVFGNCMMAPVDFIDNVSNIIYACANHQHEYDTVIYTDDKNNATVESFSW